MFQRSFFVCHAMVLTCTFDHCVTSMATVRFLEETHTLSHNQTQKDKRQKCRDLYIVEVYLF